MKTAPADKWLHFLGVRSFGSALKKHSGPTGPDIKKQRRNYSLSNYPDPDLTNGHIHDS